VKFNKTFLIAELWRNHNGKVSTAKKLIDVAKRTGFDGVKFQKRTPELTTPKNKKEVLRDTRGGRITYLKYKKKIEFNKKEFDEIDKYCKKKNIIWFGSPGEIASNDFLEKYKGKFNKVASPIIKKRKVMKEIGAKKKVTFIARGRGERKDIEKVGKIFKKENGKFC
jgi:Sialic acid synthase